jgi:hypothetical protein
MINRLFLTGLLFLGIVAGTGVLYKRYEGLQEAVSALREDRVRLIGAITEQRRTTEKALEAVDEWRLALDRYQQTLEEYREVQVRASDEVRRLNDLFARHNFGELARAKPVLIEGRVNAGTERARRVLQCATAAPGDPDCND